MKKLLLSAAAAVMAMSASAIDAEKVWNFGEMFTEVGDLTENVTIDGLTFYSHYVDGVEKQSVWSVANGTGASTDGLSFTKTLKSGGQSSWIGQPTETDPGLPESEWTPNTRMMSFEVDGPCDILLYYVSANNSATDRYTSLYAGSAENELGSTFASSPSSAIFPWHYRYTGEATTIYVYVNGVNFYGIKLTPPTEQPETVEVYTNIELAAESENPDGIANEEMGKITPSPAMPTGGYEVGTEVTFTFSGANNFALDSWEVNGETFEAKPLKITITPETTDIYAIVKYVDPYNAVPGWLSGYTVKSGSIRNWSQGSDAGRGLCCIPVSAGIATPAKADFTNYPWPAADENKAVDFPALSGAKGSQSWDFQMRVTQAGEYNVIAACANKQGTEGSIHVTVYKGEEQGADDAIVAEADGILPITFQDWNFYEVKMTLDAPLEEGIHFIQIKATSGDAGRAPQMLYAVMGLGDNYGGWYDTDERNPANKGGDGAVDSIVVDEENAPVRYYNLQGIEVNADTKGLIILSNGTKKLNK